MNNLYCKVKECTNNNCDGLCQLGRIKVNGHEPNSSAGTYCASFAEKKGSASNANCYSNATEETKIECRVHNCTYNSNNLCSAPKVNMGCSSASPKIMDETECETFKHR